MAARKRSWDGPWQQYPASRPLPTDDGIATRKQRGAMADSWWSNRLIELLDSYGLGARMTRGRRYARQGQLVSFDVQPGAVIAQVQGSRRTPYMGHVSFTPLTDAQWHTVQHEINSTLNIPARLLAGDVPPELEAVFTHAGVHLLPRRWNDLHSTCSCPDWENPCKHLAAVLYVLADRLDDDPSLLLTWRGRTRADVLAHLATDTDARSTVAPWWPLVPGAPLPHPTHEPDLWTTTDPAETLTRLGPRRTGAINTRHRPPRRRLPGTHHRRVAARQPIASILGGSSAADLRHRRSRRCLPGTQFRDVRHSHDEVSGTPNHPSPHSPGTPQPRTPNHFDNLDVTDQRGERRHLQQLDIDLIDRQQHADQIDQRTGVRPKIIHYVEAHLRQSRGTPPRSPARKRKNPRSSDLGFFVELRELNPDLFHACFLGPPVCLLVPDCPAQQPFRVSACVPVCPLVSLRKVPVKVPAELATDLADPEVMAAAWR